MNNVTIAIDECTCTMHSLLYYAAGGWFYCRLLQSQYTIAHLCIIICNYWYKRQLKSTRSKIQQNQQDRYCLWPCLWCTHQNPGLWYIEQENVTHHYMVECQTPQLNRPCITPFFILLILAIYLYPLIINHYTA